MKNLSLDTNQKEVKDTGVEAYKILNELKDLCYADDLDDFDALHDNIYWQIQGLYESLCEAYDDDWDTSYLKEFKAALSLANKIKSYRSQLLKLSRKDFEWIYG